MVEMIALWLLHVTMESTLSSINSMNLGGLFTAEITAKLDKYESYISLTIMVNITHLYDALMTTLQNPLGLNTMKKHLQLQL